MMNRNCADRSDKPWPPNLFSNYIYLLPMAPRIRVIGEIRGFVPLHRMASPKSPDPKIML